MGIMQDMNGDWTEERKYSLPLCRLLDYKLKHLVGMKEIATARNTILV